MEKYGPWEYPAIKYDELQIWQQELLKDALECSYEERVEKLIDWFSKDIGNDVFEEYCKVYIDENINIKDYPTTYLLNILETQGAMTKLYERLSLASRQVHSIYTHTYENKKPKMGSVFINIIPSYPTTK